MRRILLVLFFFLTVIPAFSAEIRVESRTIVSVVVSDPAFEKWCAKLGDQLPGQGDSLTFHPSQPTRHIKETGQAWKVRRYDVKNRSVEVASGSMPAPLNKLTGWPAASLLQVECFTE